MNTQLSTALMLILILFWGSSFVVVKIILSEGLTPIAIATYRFLIAGAIFLIALLLSKSRNPAYKLLIEKRDAPTLLCLALTGVTFFFAAQYTGIQLAGASIAAIFVCLLSPILIAISSTRLLKEKLSPRQLLGIGTAATGTATVIISGGFSFSTTSTFIAGTLILLTTPIMWTTYNLLGAKILRKYDSLLIVAYVNIIGGLCLTPFSLAENSLHKILAISPASWFGILYLSITCSVIGYYIWFYIMKNAGLTITSSFLFAEPLITIIFAAIFVNETITFYAAMGAVLIFAGVYLVTKR